jgi:hypothetical protein
MVLLVNKPPHILPLRRTCLPREKAGQVSGYFERSRRTFRDAGSNPYDPAPTIHTPLRVSSLNDSVTSLPSVLA